MGDPVLRTPCEVVTTFDKELRTLVKDLTETMIDAPGVGLAAPQIGVALRVFTYDVGDGEGEAGHLVNPVLHFPHDETMDGDEGCLSIPGLTFDCRRMSEVVAHGQNMYGDPVTVQGRDLLARCIQHETDHLDGVLFVDRLDPETKRLALEAVRNAEWANQPVPVVKASPHPLFGHAL
jgi:peptide deformylase